MTVDLPTLALVGSALMVAAGAIATAAVALERVRSLRIDVDAGRKACAKSNGGQGARLGDLGERMAVVEDRVGVSRRRVGTQGVPIATGDEDSAE